MLAAGLLVAASSALAQGAGAPGSGWVEVDYGPLVNLRELTHSGESVGMLLGRLQGRPLPPPGERPADHIAHSLLDPVLEPYAFVLADAVDSLGPLTDPPLVEVGSLWEPGQAQPAWAALLRARRLLVESDGAGRLRAILPVDPRSPDSSSAAAAERSWRAAWPVLRHVLAAEQRRLAARDGRRPEDHPLRVRVHAYRHFPERLTFVLGRDFHEVDVRDTVLGSPGRPPVDAGALRSFLGQGLRLEGARIEPDGSIRLLGSQAGAAATLLGRPIGIEDFAAAYRAVFHGGLAEPYMSLDRGPSPQTSIVSYGGRLRDTPLGWVSLLCDIRFKTFSLGGGVLEGRDLRPQIRSRIPEFRTHLERFASDPLARDVMSQQTRLWFYPDDVDLTLSPQGDVLVLRRVRMTAASERIEEATLAAAKGEDPPWTRATVEAINRQYDALAGLFPELADLDQVVRLLSLFTWLRILDDAGQPVPDLDSLLGVELPAAPTPRTYPQLLAFNALPPPLGTGPLDTFDRVSVAEALERLNPLDGRALPARLRFERALAGLDRAKPQNHQLIQELDSHDRSRLDPSTLDLLAYRAERVRMHETVLTTLPAPERDGVLLRQRGGEQLRIFSVGIGGVDLGMRRALARAGGRSEGVAWGGAGRGASGPVKASGGPPGTEVSREAHSVVEPLEVRTVLPPHGAAAERPGFWVRRSKAERRGGGALIEAVYGADGPEVRVRRLRLDENGRIESIERFEEGRLVRFRLDPSGDTRLRAVLFEPRASGPVTVSPSRTPPERLALLSVEGGVPDATASLRLGLAGGAFGTAKRVADFPREVLQRLVLGREATPEGTTLPALSPLPEELGPLRGVLVWPRPDQCQPPWVGHEPVPPGEEDPIRLARALNQWWGGTRDGEVRPVYRAAVGTDPARSIERWAAAPPAPASVALVLPAEGFPQPFGHLREEIASAWSAGPVVAELAEGATGLVVLVSAEAPGSFAERLRRLARDPRMRGRLLAAWCLTGPVRQDLPAGLLAEGLLAGVGLAEGSVVGLRRSRQALAAYASVAAGAVRVDALDGPFLWFY
jgi:hypothetical protein